MRIQDKYKSKPKPSSGGGSGGGGATNMTTATPVTNIHACVESGDLIGGQRLLTQNPSSLNERNISVRFSFYSLPLHYPIHT